MNSINQEIKCEKKDFTFDERHTSTRRQSFKMKISFPEAH